MIVAVDETNLLQAATVHAIAWQDSHRAFCAPGFVEQHTPQRQQEYLRRKMEGGSRLFMLVEGEPVGIVSVNGSLIEDLYVLPDKQGRGFGTELLRYAISRCAGTPTLWILENNTGAERLYHRMGFRRTGRVIAGAGGLDEIELALENGERSDGEACLRTAHKGSQG